MVTKRIKYGALIAVAVVAVALVAAAVLIPSTASADGYKIRANINQDCSSAPWFVGEQKGYFKAFDVNVVDRGSLIYSMQSTALVSGQVDVIDASPATLVNLQLSGAQVHAVALSGACPSAMGMDQVAMGDMHWLVLNTSGYHSIQDLVANGHVPKVGVAIPGFCMMLDDQSDWFMENNVKMSSFDFEVIPNPQLEDALRQGSIDAAVLPQSFYSVVEPRGGVRAISTCIDPSGSLGDTTVLIFTDSFIEKNPDAVRAFIQAYKGAERWANDHTSEAEEITARAVGLSNVTSHVYSYSGEITDDMLQPWIDAMVMAGTISEGQVHASDLYTTEFSDLWANETVPQPMDPFSQPVAPGTANVLDIMSAEAVRVRTAR